MTNSDINTEDIGNRAPRPGAVEGTYQGKYYEVLEGRFRVRDAGLRWGPWRAGDARAARASIRGDVGVPPSLRPKRRVVPDHGLGLTGRRPMRRKP
jgi:hypothetical protein